MLHDSGTELPIEIALDWLMAPVKVVVENSQSDGNFIGAVVHGLRRTTLMQAFDQRLWKFEHAGGITVIPEIVAQLLKDFAIPPRLFVLVDSDALQPGKEGNEAKIVRRFCNDNGIPFHLFENEKVRIICQMKYYRPSRKSKLSLVPFRNFLRSSVIIIQ